jgi:hypothetical protein
MRLRNAPLAMRNLAGLCARRARRWLEARIRDARVLARRSRRFGEQAIGSTSPSDWTDAARRTAIRAGRRAARFEEHVLGPAREELTVLRRIRACASGSAPLIVGPWVSEVGYEVLYWIPFLRWFEDRYGIDPGRVIAVSRGGVQWWYDGIASRYVDVLDVYSAEDFAARAQARRSAGDQKQLEPSAWEREIVEDVKSRMGVHDAHVLYPGLMYRLFRNFWHGDRALDFLFRHTVYERFAPRHDAKDALSLPPTFAAVKFYTGAALPDTPDTREQLRFFVGRLADRMPVVTLDTGLGLDEHRDYLFRDIPAVTDLRRHLTPENNLAVQSRVIARASLFAGTCGSLAWLAPMLGVPAVAVYADDRYLTAHLYAARYAYRRMKAARFSVTDLQALRRVSAA